MTRTEVMKCVGKGFSNMERKIERLNVALAEEKEQLRKERELKLKALKEVRKLRRRLNV